MEPLAPASPPEDSDGSQPLDECTGGFDRDEEPERPCNWKVNDRCFEEKLDACACACPRGTAVTTCSSGFPWEDGQVPVYCS